MGYSNNFGYPAFDETGTSCWSRLAADGYGMFDDTREKLNALLNARERWVKNNNGHSTQLTKTGERSIDDHRESTVVQMHLLEGYTFREVGEVLGVCCSRVMQIEAKTLRVLRHPIRSRYFQAYGDSSGKGGFALTARWMDEIHARVR